jgi:hypothetical protein
MSANLDEEVKPKQRGFNGKAWTGRVDRETHAMVSNGDIASFGALSDS